MHFSTITILALTCATGTIANVQWKEGSVGNINKAALHDCVNNFGGWASETYCGGAKWNLGGQSYNSPDDCKAACRDGLNARIDKGLDKVTCDDYEGSAHCWFMYWTNGNGL